MLHITFNTDLVLSGSAWSPSGSICSHLTAQNWFCLGVVTSLQLFDVLLSEASKEQLVCNACSLDCGQPTQILQLPLPSFLQWLK